MKTKILANFKMQLNRSILRKEICSVVIISEIIYSKIAKVFDTGISCILETETLCALKLMWPGSRSLLDREHSKSKLADNVSKKIKE